MSAKLPVLFVDHGNPMNVMEDNEFSQAWEAAGKSPPKPRAIICISAHWVRRGTIFADKVTGGSLSMRSVKIG